MKILITGGVGFIGSHLVRALVRAGKYDVVIVDDLSSGSVDFIQDLISNLTFYKINICNIDELRSCFEIEKPDVVIHLAALHFIPECDAHPERAINTNINGTNNLVLLSDEYAVKHFIFASSASVYSTSEDPKCEDDVVGPTSLYGCTKVCGEHLVQNLTFSKWTIMRFFNIIGKNETHDHLIPVILRQLKQGNCIVIGNPDTKRDYLFVDDLILGIKSVIEDQNAFQQVINFGTGRAMSARDIIYLLGDILKKDLHIKIDSSIVRNVDAPMLVSLISKAQTIISWNPKHDLRKALSKMME